jgi:SAM-dependent methyltransferase
VPQNVYDDPEFFAGYAGMPRSVHGLDAAPEWPALRAMLPPLAGLRVVDLGCGFGWFCRWAAAAGAASVLGLDVSERMLERAVRETADPRVAYRREDLEDVEALGLDPGAFDLAYSSLTLHYLPDIDRVLAGIRAALAPGGMFVASVEHPIYTAPSAPAFVPRASGRPVWPLDRYLDRGRRVTDWLAPGVVKYHHTVSDYVTAMLRAGFTLTALEEWGPTDEQVAEHPDWAGDHERPLFLLLSGVAATVAA